MKDSIGLRSLAVFVLVASMLAGVIVAADGTRAEGLPSGVTFGAYAQPIGGQNNTDAIIALENDLGRKLPMVRAFSDWDDSLGQDKKFHRWVRDGGRQLMVSIKPKHENGQIIRWRAIADAQPGSALHNDMIRLADGARRFGEPFVVGFHHEPEHKGNLAYGDSDDFKAAFRKLHDVFAAHGAHNVSFAWILTSWAFEVGDNKPNDRRQAHLWYPGDDIVDYISVQSYNWNNCRNTTNEPWESLQSNIEPFMRFARLHPDKKLILAEWGSDEGAAGQKAAWLDDARALFKSGEHRDRFAAVLYFHDDGTAEGWPHCDWWLNSSSSTLNAAKRINNDSFYRTPLSVDGGAVRCMGRAATIVGTSDDDVLVGTNGADVIHALGGNDVIDGRGGNDIICAGSGRDRAFGGDGHDVINGEAGNDVIVGGRGRDRIIGGTGRDRLRGGPQPDTVIGQAGNDRMRGNGANDVLRGGNGADRLVGGNGVDRCDGGPGSDTIDATCN